MQVGAVLLARTARVRSFFTRHLERSFGRTVEVRSYSVSLFPAPKLDAEGITVGEDPAFGHEYFLRADRLSAGLRWSGLLRGRFELGTLQLDAPSLIFARNAEGRWNLERWLPAAVPMAGTADAKPSAQSTPAHHLQKLEINDGRVSFKVGDDKLPFAFVLVEGSVEQTSAGRWQLDLKAAPWRSGVSLQLAGTVRLQGDVAGTSTRLQPAHLRMSWAKCSLADVFRLVGGQDYGVRGVFSAEASAESDAGTTTGKNAIPGDWTFAVHARAGGIHRWDLTERADNPRIGVSIAGRWNPGAGTARTDQLVIETPRSNLRGTASFRSVEESSAEVNIDSAGVQAADLLDWYRAFRPGVAEEIRARQSFTGTLTLHGWPLEVTEAAFSSAGGTWNVPGFAGPLDVRALRGGTQKGKLIVDPFGVTFPASKALATSVVASAGPAKPPARSGASVVNVSLTHDFQTRTGSVGLEGQISSVEDLFRLAAAFGRQIENGWELQGRASGDLHWEWAAGRTPVWNGRADVSQAVLQLAGLNQPVQLASVHGDWRNATRRFTLAKVSAFGANWTGSLEQSANPLAEFAITETPLWHFQLQADHLDAADLDRWIGPRARPSWLQRLLSAGLSGTPAPAPSAILARIRAEGELRVDELAIEKMKLRQFRTQAALASLKVNLKDARAQWADGEISGSADVAFSAKPTYEVDAEFDRIALGQLPWLARFSDRLAGTASGDLHLHAEGIGREPLLASLSGKGEIRLSQVELRGWDLAGTLAQGEWKQGVSRWASGTGTFHLSDGGLDLNTLRLTSSSDELSLKGSVSFSDDADLIAESHLFGRNARVARTPRFLQISGPLTGPKVSLEKAGAQQPGD